MKEKTFKKANYGFDFEIERHNYEKEKISKGKSEKKMLLDFSLQKSKKYETEAIKVAREYMEKIENDSDSEEDADEEQLETYDFAIDYNF